MCIIISRSLSSPPVKERGNMVDKKRAKIILDEIEERMVLLRDLMQEDTDPCTEENRQFAHHTVMLGVSTTKLKQICEK